MASPEQTKLTEPDVVAIRKSSDSIAKLSRQFGVAEATIRQVVFGRTWKHVFVDGWVPRQLRTAIDRFTEKYYVKESTGCWVWLGTRSADGFARFRINSKLGYARRFIWLHEGRPLSDDEILSDRCGDRSCVNPDHLFAQLRNRS